MFSSLDLFLKLCRQLEHDQNFNSVRRDVDDPEYKPAPALLKDDMEVRTHESKAHVSVYDEAYYILTLP